MFTLSIKRIIGLALFALGLGLILLPFRSAFADWNDPAVQYGYSVTRNDPAVFQATNGNERLRLKKMADIERASAPTVHFDATVKSNYMCDWAYDKVLGRYVCEKNYLKAYQYTHPTPIPVCPFGYKLNYGKTHCVEIGVPTNAHYNSAGTGWECNPGYHLNYTHSGCLCPEYVYQQCPGGSASCGSSGCGASACASGTCTVRTVQPIISAVPIVVQPIIVMVDQDDRPQPKPIHLPQTGPTGLVLLAIGSIGAGWRFVRRRF